MIRHSQPRPDFELTDKDPAYLETVAKDEGLPVVAAGDWLYCVRRVPLLGQPLIYRCRVEVTA